MAEENGDADAEAGADAEGNPASLRDSASRSAVATKDGSERKRSRIKITTSAGGGGGGGGSSGGGDGHRDEGESGTDRRKRQRAANTAAGGNRFRLVRSSVATDGFFTGGPADGARAGAADNPEHTDPEESGLKDTDEDEDQGVEMLDSGSETDDEAAGDHGHGRGQGQANRPLDWALADTRPDRHRFGQAYPEDG